MIPTKYRINASLPDVFEIDNLTKYRACCNGDLAHMPDICVYFLWESDVFNSRKYKLVYIGKTTIGAKRIHSHNARGNKGFTHVSFFACATNADAKYIEQTYIEMFKPKYNQMV